MHQYSTKTEVSVCIENEHQSEINPSYSNCDVIFSTGFTPPGPCSGGYFCPEEERFERCMCYRDCGYDGEPVCGSDGVIYQNQCQMEVAGCRNNTKKEQVAMSQCVPGIFIK